MTWVLAVGNGLFTDQVSRALNQTGVVPWSPDVAVPAHDAPPVATLLDARQERVRDDLLCRDIASLDTPLIVRFPIAGGCGSRVLRIARISRNVVLSPEEFDEIGQMVVGESETLTPVAAILRRVGPLVSDDTIDLFIAVLVAAARGMRLRDALALYTYADSTARAHVAVRGEPTLRTQLRWTRALIAIYRAVDLKWPGSRVAARGKFRDPTRVSHLVHECTGHAVKDWRTRGGWEAALEEYVKLWVLSGLPT